MDKVNAVAPLLSVKNICVSIGQEYLLNQLSLDVYAGELVCIIGPNGAGKTTLLRAISSDVSLTSGEIQFCSRGLQSWSAQERAKQLSVLPQASLLNFPFVVEDVIALSRIPHSSGLLADTAIIKEAMQALDIEHLTGRVYTQLSGGEKQRVQLARVFSQIWRAEDAEPRLLILDEPVTSLDMGHQQQLMAIVKQFAQSGVAVLMVLHDINLASQCADQIIALKEGSLFAMGSPQEVVAVDSIRQLFNADVNVFEHPITGKPLIVL